MSEYHFQKAFAELVTDTNARRAFYANEAPPLWSLSADQETTLRMIDRERLEIFAELLILNRLGKAAEGLPWTTKLLGTDIWALAQDFNQAWPPQQTKKYDEAIAFGRFLDDHFRTESAQFPYIRDVLSYEMASLELRFEFNGHYDPAPGEPDFRLKGNPLSNAEDTARPRLVAHSRVLSFDYDIESLVNEIETAETANDVEKREFHILMHVQPSGILNQTAINLPTVRFLQLCRGQTLAEIIEQLATEFHCDTQESFHRFRTACLELCESLLADNVIVLKTRVNHGSANGSRLQLSTNSVPV